MHIISRKALKAAAAKHSGLGPALDVWFRIAKKASWRSLAEVKQTYRHADSVTAGENTFTIFNIGGNKFRLIVKIDYRYQKIFIKHVLTHAEYDKGGWKK